MIIYVSPSTCTSLMHIVHKRGEVTQVTEQNATSPPPVLNLKYHSKIRSIARLAQRENHYRIPYNAKLQHNDANKNTGNSLNDDP